MSQQSNNFFPSDFLLSDGNGRRNKTKTIAEEEKHMVPLSGNSYRRSSALSAETRIIHATRVNPPPFERVILGMTGAFGKTSFNNIPIERSFIDVFVCRPQLKLVTPTLSELIALDFN